MLPWGQVLWAAGGSVLRQGTRASDARPRLLPRALQWPQSLYSTTSDNEMQDENPETRIKARRAESREIGELIFLCVELSRCLRACPDYFLNWHQLGAPATSWSHLNLGWYVLA